MTLEEKVDHASGEDAKSYEEMMRWHPRLRYKQRFTSTSGRKGIVWYASEPPAPGWGGSIHVFWEDDLSHDVIGLKEICT